MRILFSAFLLLIAVTDASAADLGDRSYTGADAGYLVMSVGWAKQWGPAISLALDFRKADRSDKGVVSRGTSGFDFAVPKDFEDGNESGSVVVRGLHPGDYEFFRIRLLGGEKNVRWQFFPYFEVPFTIKPGEITYIGDFDLHDRDRGLSTTSGYDIIAKSLDYYFVVTDKNARDIPIATNRRQQPARGAVNTAVPDGKLLKTPFIRSEPDLLGTTSPDSYRAWEKGRQDLGERHFADAIRSLTEALADKTLSPYLEARTLNSRGRALLALGRPDQAIADLTQALVIDAYYFAAYGNRGIGYAQKGAFDLALADQTKAVDSDPDGSLYRSGDVYQEDDALSVSFLRLARSDTYFAMGRYDQALIDINAAIRLDPRDAYNYFGRARVYHATGKTALALDDYSEAISRASGNDQVELFYRGRGQSYFLLARYDRAISDFRKNVDAGKANAEDYSGLCMARVISKKDQGAVQDCDRAVMMAPRSPDAREARADVYLEFGRYAQAIEDYSAALMIRPRFASSLYGRGVAKTKSGDAESGLLDIDAAQQIESGIAGRMAKMGISP